MEIVRMTLSDAKDASELEKAVFSRPWSQSQLEGSLRLKNAMFFKAVEDGRLAGYIGLVYALDEADVMNLAVEEKSRRKGVGRRLLRTMILSAGEVGIRQIFLEVRESNAAAVRLYESEGFVQVGRRKDYYEDPREDALLYVLSHGDENEEGRAGE